MVLEKVQNTTLLVRSLHFLIQANSLLMLERWVWLRVCVCIWFNNWNRERRWNTTTMFGGREAAPTGLEAKTGQGPSHPAPPCPCPSPRGLLSPPTVQANVSLFTPESSVCLPVLAASLRSAARALTWHPSCLHQEYSFLIYVFGFFPLSSTLQLSALINAYKAHRL